MQRLSSWFRSVMMLLLLIASGSAAWAQNLVPDPGFELGTGWTAGVAGGYPATGIQRAGVPHSGAYGYRISNLAYGSIYSGFITVSPGASYNLSTYVRGELDPSSASTVNPSRIILYYYNSAGAAISAKSYDVINIASLTTTWTRLSGVFATPAGTAKVKVVPSGVTFSGWMDFDDVQLIKAGTTTNLVPNASFEAGTGWTTGAAAGYPATGLYRWSGGTGHTGTCGFRISNQAYGSLTSGFITVSPGASYTVSAYVRGELDPSSAASGNPSRIILNYYNSAGAAISAKPYDVINIASLTTTWTRFSRAFTTPAGTVKVKVVPSGVSFSGWMDFDDVQLIKAGSATNLVPDAGFEAGTGWTTGVVAGYPATGFQRWSGVGHSGTHGYRISNQAYGSLTSGFITVSPGASYTVSAWVRGELDPSSAASVNPSRIVLYYYNSAGAAISAKSYDVINIASLTATWKSFSGVFTTPAGTAKVKVQPSSVAFSGWMDFDDVSLVVTPTYSISGKVGLAGVTVKAGGKTVSSDANGNYKISGLIAGTYTVTPTRAGCPFSPASKTGSVGPSKANVDFTSPCLLTYQSSNKNSYVDNYIRDFPYGSTTDGSLTWEELWTKPFDSSDPRCCPPGHPGFCGNPVGPEPTPSCMPGIPFYSATVTSPSGNWNGPLCAGLGIRTHARRHLIGPGGEYWWSGFRQFNLASPVLPSYILKCRAASATSGCILPCGQGQLFDYDCSVVQMLDSFEIMDPIGGMIYHYNSRIPDPDPDVHCAALGYVPSVDLYGAAWREVFSGEITPDGYGIVPTKGTPIFSTNEKYPWVNMVPANKNLYAEKSFGFDTFSHTFKWAVPRFNPKGHAQYKTRPQFGNLIDPNVSVAGGLFGSGRGPVCPIGATCYQVSPRAIAIDLDKNGTWDRFAITGYLSTTNQNLLNNNADLYDDMNGHYNPTVSAVNNFISNARYWGTLSSNYQVFGHSLGGADALVIYQSWAKATPGMRVMVFAPAYPVGSNAYRPVPGANPVIVYADPRDYLTNGPGNLTAERRAAGAIVYEIDNYGSGWWSGGNPHNRNLYQKSAGISYLEWF